MTSADGGTHNVPSPDPTAAIAAIYERYRKTIYSQVAVLEEAVAALRRNALDDDLRGRAHREAHKLAGSAGTFGFSRASDLARDIEASFQQTPMAVTRIDVARLAAAVVAIREDLSATPDAGGVDVT